MIGLPTLRSLAAPEMFMATSVTSRGRTVDAIPLDRVRAVLAKYNVGGR